MKLKKRSITTFLKNIDKATKESEIEDIFSKLLKIDLEKAGSTDGIYENCIFEFKYDMDIFNEPYKVLAQLCNYIKDIKSGKIDFENFNNLRYGLIVTKENCLVIDIEKLNEYIDCNDYKWNFPPSSPDVNLIEDLKKFDLNNAEYFELKEEDQIQNFATKFSKLLEDDKQQFKLKITEHNYEKIYKRWHEKFGKYIEETKKYNDKEKQLRYSVDLFLLDIKDARTLVENKGSLLFEWVNCDGKDEMSKIRINPLEYKQFWKKYIIPVDNEVYSIINNCKDNLVDIYVKRRKGEFFTPVSICKFEIEETNRTLNEKDGGNKMYNTGYEIGKYKIWDMAAGTGNLLKPFTPEYFENMYISTYFSSDIAEMNTNNTFPGATKFQFDFLNDPIKNLPSNIKNDLKNNKIKWLFLLNPPYSAPTGSIKGNNKKDVINTKVKELMDNDKQIKSNKCTLDLQMQFLYRICWIKKKFNLDLKLILVSPIMTLLTKETYNDMREIMFDNFELHNEISTYNSQEWFNTDGDFSINVSFWKTK